MTEFKSNWWSLQIPTDWHAEEDDVCVTFNTEPEIGALQVSAARNDSGPATDDDLLDFAQEHIEAGAKISETAFGAFTGFYFHYPDEEFYSREWFLRCDNTVVFVTYTCGLELKGQEDTIVDGILTTLKKI
jgi:hypothetical protein